MGEERKNQQDLSLILEKEVGGIGVRLCCVVDGMGEYAFGDKAAEIFAQQLENEFRELSELE